MTIRIRDLTFNAILGILPQERITPQKVIVQCRIDYDYRGAFINYADVCNHIQERMQACKFELIEEALLDLEASLKHTFETIKAMELIIEKPTIIFNAIVSVGNTVTY